MKPRIRIVGVAIVAVLGLFVGLINASGARATTPTTIVSLTFDDGPVDDTQLPTLLQGLPATLFVNSGRIGLNGYLTWDQLTALRDGGYEVGGHTVTHADLPTLSTAEQQRQVCDDRSTLKDHGFSVKSFAYPFGDMNSATETIVKNCGYNSARSIGSLWSTTSCSACAHTNAVPPADPYDISTPDSIKSGTTLSDLQALVTGAQSNGGGWLPLVFHHLCAGSNCTVYSVDPTVLSNFASWLKTQTDVQVKTVDSVIGGAEQPAVAGPPAPPPAPGTQLVQNPSLETVSSGTLPDCWQKGQAGLSNPSTNSPTWTHTATAHTGSFGERLAMANFNGGDAKFVTTQDLGQCAPPVTGGRTYNLTAWYQTDAPVVLISFYRDGSNAWHYLSQNHNPLPTSNTWAKGSLSIQAPANAKALSVGMAITGNGSVVMDDFSLIDADHPTVSLTSPKDGSTVKGLTSVTADASAPSGISKVQLLVDGQVVGTTTTAPYSFAWKSKTHPDGTASLAVRATDNHGNVATSSSILVTVANNPPPGSTGPDHTAPVVKPFALPVATLASKIRVAWVGTDSGTGVASYDVRYRRASYSSKGFKAWTYPAAWQHATVGAVSLPLSAGYDYCVQVRARDNAGNRSAWSAARCVARALDDRALGTSHGWKRGKGKAFYEHTYTSTKSRHASLRLLSAHVDRVGLVATRCHKCGTVAIYVGKKLIHKIKLTASTTQRKRLIMLPRFAYRKGTIKIKVRSAHKLVQVDGLVASRT